MTGRIIPVLLLVLLFLLMIGAMVRGWRRRGSAQQDLPPLPQATAGGRALEVAADAVNARGVYVSTTLAEQPLERVVAHGLGARSRATLTEAADAGRTVLLVEREGAPSFQIPLADVASLHTAPGMAGKWVGGDGLLVLRWRLGETLLDTGFRLDRPEDRDRLLDLAPAGPDRTGTAPTTTPPDSTAPEARKEHP